MWWKFPLLFLIGAPLAYRSWQEIRAHRGVEGPAVTLPSRDELDAKKAEQIKRAEAVAGAQLPDVLASAVFRGSVEPLREDVSKSKDLPRRFIDLAAKTDLFLAEVKRVRDFVETLSALEDDPKREGEYREPPYAGWLDARRKEVDPLHKKDLELQDRFRSLDAAVKGLLERPRRSEVLGQQSAADILAGELETQKAECARFPGLRERAEWKQTHAVAYRELLGIVLDEEKIRDELLTEDVGRGSELRLKPDERRAKVLGHLTRYADLLKDARGQPVPEEVRQLVRAQAGRFVRMCVPARVAEENLVLFYEKGAMGRSKPVAREEVWVWWKGRPPGAKDAFERLLDYRKDFDVRPPDDELVDYYFLKTGGTGYKVEATPYNRSARYFNDNRDRLTALSEDSLRQFLEDAPLKGVREEDTPAVLLRLRLLREAAENHPGLFPMTPIRGS